MVARILALLGLAHERWAMRHGYALVPTRRRLAVSREDGRRWCDLESPCRVLETRRSRDIGEGCTGANEWQTRGFRS